MVRLERYFVVNNGLISVAFTFQYGQIRKGLGYDSAKKLLQIYIPVWLDQKAKETHPNLSNFLYLHSSMVRLERTIQKK